MKAITIGLLALLLLTPLAAEIGSSNVSDYAFMPTEDDGYIQAWNIDFRGKNSFIYVTFLVSNVGPGSWNNGVSVLVHRNGQSRIWTTEYSIRSLKAQPGTFGHKSGLSRIGYDGGRLVIHAENPGGGASPAEPLSLDLVLTPIARGVQISGGQIEPEPGSFLRADIPLTSALAKMTLTIGGVTETIEGIGGFEALWASKSPHTYAKRFLLMRTFSADQGIILGGYFGKKSANDFLLRYAVLKKNEIVASGNVEKVDVVSSQPDGFSGYTIPVNVKYSLSNGCEITEQRQYFAGGFDVLGSVSSFLRWILRVFFAKPYVMHFDALLTYTCKGGKPMALDAQSSYYLINP